MNDGIVKREDAHAIARSMAQGMEKRVQEIVQDVHASQQMSPVEMQQMIIRITGALEGIALSQQKIIRLLEVRSASDVYR